MTDILSVRGLHAGYGPIEVLHGLDFTVGQGEIVVILGANGAGKTTTLRAVSGLIPRRGAISLDGHDISKLSGDQIVQRGVAHVPPGSRHVRGPHRRGQPPRRRHHAQRRQDRE